MPPLKDLTGHTFHRLTVVSRAPPSDRVRWLCRCACHALVIVGSNRLTSGRAHSCGCWRREQSRARREKPKPQPGDRHGRLTILTFLGADSRHPSVRCQCDCGTIFEPHWGNVKKGVTKSCGCLRVEQLVNRSTTHGLSRSAEFSIWADMIARCSTLTNRSYARYGGRGITVCAQWLDSFEQFYADMGPRPSPRHSIDRIENDGHYESTNCRWATAQTQRVNQRRTVLLTHHGVSGTLKDLARHVGLRYSAVRQRVTTMSWSLDRALTTPVQVRHPSSKS